jgi:hypothetical protein
MILDNHLTDWHYATVLVCDIHKEYPLAAPATVLWDPNELNGLCEAFNVSDKPVHDFADTVLKPHVEGFDDWASVWRIRGDLNTIRSVFDQLAQDLMGGPRGADDDTFDYWPNAFDMLISMAKDLITLYREYDRDQSYLIDTVDRVIQSAIALNGPLEEWEADELPRALHELRVHAEEQDIINLNNEGKEAL